MPITPHELTHEEYLATFSAPMKDVTKTADELVDLWTYADLIIESEYHSCTAWEWHVAYIYESNDGSYQHIGIPVPKDDTYLVVIVSRKAKAIVGHHILDLHSLYSKNGPHDA